MQGLNIEVLYHGNIKIGLNSTHFELYICALLCYSCNENSKEAKPSGNDKHILYYEAVTIHSGNIIVTLSLLQF